MTASDSRPISARLEAAAVDARNRAGERLAMSYLYAWEGLHEAVRAVLPDIERLERERDRLRVMLDTALGDIEWMSGSADFAPEGQAHVGWLAVRERLNSARRALAEGGTEG